MAKDTNVTILKGNETPLSLDRFEDAPVFHDHGKEANVISEAKSHSLSGHGYLLPCCTE